MAVRAGQTANGCSMLVSLPQSFLHLSFSILRDRFLLAFVTDCGGKDEPPLRHEKPEEVEAAPGSDWAD